MSPRPPKRGKGKGKPRAHANVGAGRRSTGRKVDRKKLDKRETASGETSREEGPAPGPVPPLPEVLTAYVAAPGLEGEVEREVGEVLHRHGRVLLAAGPPRPTVWAQDVWLDCRSQPVASIGEAAKALRAVQRNWAPLPIVEHRRMVLLGEKLPPIKDREWAFPSELPSAPLGAYTLLDRTTLLYSAKRRSPFAHGEIRFQEEHEGPPSRAYRKLWEVFTLLGLRPQRGERCIDMGASPGGWTWALARLGANVRSVDKAPIDPAIAALPNVRTRVESAFGMDPAAIATPYDWFFSDVICEPKRLLTMVQRWRAAGAAKRFVCTIKFKGETDHRAVEAFAAIPGSQLMHLCHNRHELTWVCLAEGDVSAAQR